METNHEKTFIDHFNDLKGAADQLQGMTEPDVDKIIPLVNQGMQAYKEVKARIAAVREALDEMQG